MKTCPHCNGPGELIWDILYCVACMKCGARTEWYDREEDAVRAWERRDGMGRGQTDLEEYHTLCPLKELRRIAKLLDDGRLAAIPYRPEGNVYVIPPEYMVDQDSQISIGEITGMDVRYIFKMSDGILRDFRLQDVGKTVFFSRRKAAEVLKAIQNVGEDS